jgi:hypothetical protein
MLKLVLPIRGVVCEYFFSEQVASEYYEAVMRVKQDRDRVNLFFDGDYWVVRVANW